MTISHRNLPFAVLLCALLWGSAFAGIKAIYAAWESIGISADLSQRVLIAGIRFMIAGAALLLIAKNPIKEWQQTPKKNLLAFSLLQTYLQYICFYSALAVSSAVLGSLLASTGSFWWLLLAPLILKSPFPNRKQWCLFLLGAIGVAIAVYDPGNGAGNVTLGVILFLCSTFCGALAITIYQKVTPTMGARAATGFSLFIGGCLLVLTGFSAWHQVLDLLSPTVIMLTLYLAVVSAIGFGLWNYLSQLFPVHLLAGYRFFIPVCAVIESSLLVKGESPSIAIGIGAVFVVLSIIGLQLCRNQHKKGEPNGSPSIK